MIRDNKWTKSYVLEKYGPVAIAFTAFIGVTLYKTNLLSNSNFIEALKATISVSAVLVGFMGTMIAILISNLDSKTINHIKDNDHIELLNSYFHSALLSGFVLAVGSTICIFTRNTEGFIAYIISDVWVFVSTFFVLASLRVIIIMLSILKSISQEKEVSQYNHPAKADIDKAFPDNTIEL